MKILVCNDDGIHSPGIAALAEVAAEFGTVRIVAPHLQRALWAIDFFKTRWPTHIMHTVRALAYRAAPDSREITLVRAMAIEVFRALERARAQSPADPS